MKTKLMTIACGSVVAVMAFSLAFGQHVTINSAKIPPGVDPSRWKALGDDFGVVFQVEGGGVTGKFMIRVDGVWRPLSVGPPEGILKLNQRT
jgi:hypothetical protein